MQATLQTLCAAHGSGLRLHKGCRRAASERVMPLGWAVLKRVCDFAAEAGNCVCVFVRVRYRTGVLGWVGLGSRSCLSAAGCWRELLCVWEGTST